MANRIVNPYRYSFRGCLHLWWWRGTAADIKLMWQLARHGEVMILNALDAIQSARNNFDYPLSNADDETCERLDLAMRYLKRVINYVDEPEPTFPDEEHEADGLMHVVPKDYA